MAVARGTINGIITASSGSTLTGNMTVDTDANGVSIIFLAFRESLGGSISVSTATLGGVAMTEIGSKVTSAALNVASYQILSSDSGTGTRSLSFSFSANLSAAAAAVINYNGVDQSTPVRTGSYTSSSADSDGSADATLAITSQAGDMTTMGSFSNGGSPTTPAPQPSGQATLQNALIASIAYRFLDDAPGSSTNTHHINTFFAGTTCPRQGFSIQAAVSSDTSTTEQRMAAIAAHIASGGMYGRMWR